jgi:hypothetical protein
MISLSGADTKADKVAKGKHSIIHLGFSGEFQITGLK